MRGLLLHASPTRSSSPSPFFHFALAVIFIVLAPGISCFAREQPSLPALATPLPDAPSAVAAAAAKGSSASNGIELDLDAPGPQQTLPGKGPGLLGPRVKLVRVGKIAPPQHSGDKLFLSIHESVTPFAMLGWTLSASWSQIRNNSPNYGTNGKDFAQRLGAAAALNSSKEIFSDGILATAFHQDPRYYQLGRSHPFTHRVIYAATRAIIGRTDGGRTIPNYAFILGTGGAAALTHTYYPERNVTVGQVMQTWPTSLGGSAVGYIVSEFRGDIADWLHIRKLE